MAFWPGYFGPFGFGRPPFGGYPFSPLGGFGGFPFSPSPFQGFGIPNGFGNIPSVPYNPLSFPGFGTTSMTPFQSLPGQYSQQPYAQQFYQQYSQQPYSQQYYQQY